MKVFFSTVWDLYFFWRFDCKQKMIPDVFYGEIKKHLDFMLIRDEDMPNLEDAIKELYTNFSSRIDDYCQCDAKKNFVEEYG